MRFGLTLLCSLRLFPPTSLLIKLKLISLRTTLLVIKGWYGILWIGYWDASPFNIKHFPLVQTIIQICSHFSALIRLRFVELGFRHIKRKYILYYILLPSFCQLAHSPYTHFLEKLLKLPCNRVHYLDIVVYWNYYHYHYIKLLPTWVMRIVLFCYSKTFWNFTDDKNVIDQNTGSFGVDCYLHDFTITS